MTTLRRGVVVTLVVAVAMTMVAIASLFTCYPKVPPAETRTIEATPELIERGRYLAEHVAACTTCHSQRDWSSWGGPPKPGTAGAGGEVYGPELGMPGTIVTPNITPAALEGWSDGDLVHAITTGVSSDGRSLFPLMPYRSYAGLCERDAEAIAAYLRTLPRVDAMPPPTELEWQMKIVVRMMPGYSEPPPCPPAGAHPAARGAYLARAAGCADCHTPMVEGRPDLARAFAGGNEYPMPWGMVRSANLTSDEFTGIGRWDEAAFVARFEPDPDAEARAASGAANTHMPWRAYRGLSDADRRDLWAFFSSLDAISNPVRQWDGEDAPPAVRPASP